MRAPDDMPTQRRRSGRSRTILFVVVVVGFLLLTSVRGIATFLTDRMWFSSVGFVETFDTVLWTKLALGVGFTLLFAVLLSIDLAVANRLAPVFRPASPEDEFLGRYQDLIDRRSRLVRLLVALGFGVIAGAGMSARWQDYLLWANSQSFNSNDATYGLDLGFYVFELPFYVVLVDWLFASLIIVILVTLGWYYINGGIRLQSPLQRITPQVKAHLSLLLALLALVKGVSYLLEQYLLVYSNRGGVEVAGYTAVHVEQQGLRLLALIALAAAVLLVVNVWRRGWVLPAVVVVLWGVVQLTAGSILPAAVQKWVVDPSQSSREGVYVDQNIAATRESYNMVPGDNVDTKAFAYDGSDDAAETRRNLEANPETVRNIRLLDPSQMTDSFQKLQRQQEFYRFVDIDVDRYPLQIEEGTEASTAMLVSTRDLNREGLQNPSWENLHIAYTHGYGVAVAAANAVVGGGDPDFLIGNVPTEYQDTFSTRIEQPYVYHGNISPAADDFVVVKAEGREEIGYLDAEQNPVPNTYDGSGGVPIGSTADRVLFALRFADWNLVVSSFIGPESRLMLHRDVGRRVEELAPFIAWDNDPYPVLVNGRIQFLVDGYTITDRYPNAQSQRSIGAVVPETSGLKTEFNYVRNSVKAVVDSYDGTVRFYAWDEDEPILQAYQAAFPGMFLPRDQMHSELQAHVRYPEDLFKVQSSMWETYRIDGAEAFLQKSGAWSIASDPGTEPPKNQNEATTSEKPIEPYYVLMNLPGESRPEFVLIRPYVPYGKDNSATSTQKLSAFMVARSDGENYGQMVVYQLPSPLAVDGPTLVNSAINSDDEISGFITPRNLSGSNVRFGNMVLVPVGDSLLWVRPLYVVANDLVQLKQVIVVWGEEIAMEPTLKLALEELFGATEVQTLERPDLEGTEGEGTEGEGTGGEGTSPPSEAEGLERVAELLAEAEAKFAEADTALAEGKGLGEYERLIGEANARTAEAQKILEESGLVSTTTSSTTTTTTASPPA